MVNESFSDFTRHTESREGLSLVALCLPRIIRWQLCSDEETHSVMAAAQMLI